MKVSEIMTKDVMTVKRDTSVNEVAKLMGAHDISGVPVVDDENHVVGIITELDLIVRNTRLEMPHFMEVMDWGRIPLERPSHAKERLAAHAGHAGRRHHDRESGNDRPGCGGGRPGRIDGQASFQSGAGGG